MCVSVFVTPYPLQVVNILVLLLAGNGSHYNTESAGCASVIHGTRS